MPHLRCLRRAALLLLAALLLGSGCRGVETGSALSAQGTAPSAETPRPTDTPESTFTPQPVAVTLAPVTPTPTGTPAPTPTVTPTPEPTPTPVPTPSGLCGGRYPDKFTEEVVITDTSYQSPDLAIFMSEVADKETFTYLVTYYVADIYVQDITLLRTAPAGKGFHTVVSGSVKQMAKDNNALFAASGDYYAHTYQSLVIRNGVSYRKDLSTRFESCVLFRDGTIAFYQPEELDAEALLEAGAWQGWTFGPSLLTEDGQPFSTIPKKYVGVDKKNPRCMLGYYEPGHYCLVVADGRQRNSAGLTLLELSKLAHALGCTKAYNLDGGQSAQLYWQGKIFNNPAGGGRPISDIIYCALPEETPAPEVSPETSPETSPEASPLEP